jgi:hypothetical protein
MRTADNFSVFLTEDMIGSEALDAHLVKHLHVERRYIETRVELLRQYRSQYSDPGAVCIICSDSNFITGIASYAGFGPPEWEGVGIDGRASIAYCSPQLVCVRAEILEPDQMSVEDVVRCAS